MKRKVWILYVTISLLAMNGIAKEIKTGPTLADLPDAELPSKIVQEARAVNINRVVEDYRRALAITSDPQIRQHILVRLANLEITRSEQNQLASTTLEKFYDTPIAQYNELITAYKNEPDAAVAAADVLYYQLAKAYALDGRDIEATATLDSLADSFPESEYWNEAQFRRAEKAFSESKYAQAEALYKDASNGQNAAINENARYMQGWSQYKRGNYIDAIDTFDQLLKNHLGAAKTPEEAVPVLAALTPAARSMVDDALRVMSFSFANLDGAQSISEFQNNSGQSSYQYLFYSHLGSLYLEQERYQDSADTFLLFVKNNPNVNMAPEFSIRTIEVYEKGNFPSLVLPAKQEFVKHYGITGEYWRTRASVKENNILSISAMENLHLYITELAQYEHARAQGLLAKVNSPEEGVIAATDADVKEAFDAAAQWYKEFIQTFPNDERIGEMTFLMAEAFNQSEQLLLALNAYETVAFKQQDTQYGADAGYSTVLLTNGLMQQAEQQDRAAGITKADNNYQAVSAAWLLQQRKIENSLRFSELYSNDSRAVTVLAETAPTLLQLGELEQAALVAEKILAWQPVPEGSLQYSAWLVLGHSRFDRSMFSQAETAYWEVLTLHPTQKVESRGLTEKELRERIAASIYKQAETALTEQNPTAAISQFLRITQQLPKTSIAVQALFDAGNTAQQSENWSQAIDLLAQFRALYPNHELTAQLPSKLISVYQSQGNWMKAADELSLQSRTSTDSEVARQSLFTAAEYYDKESRWELTRDHYRTYANTYAEPLADLIEAQQRLSELYEEKNEISNRNFWLNKLLSRYKNTNSPTDRAHYLAARATSLFSESSFEGFTKISLTLPLNKSLSRKKKALETALAAQTRVLDFKIAEFTTKANFHIGEIYIQLSQALMNSERPNNLSVLELEQYDILLEEQAYPFEEKAIDLHAANAERSWSGIYDPWVQQSIDSLAKILPARYGKKEHTAEAFSDIF